MSIIEDPIIFYFSLLYAVDVIGMVEHEWGYIISLRTLLNFILAYPMGKVVDMFNKWMLIALFNLIAVAGVLIYISAENLIQAAIYIAIITVVGSVIRPSMLALITELSNPIQRGRIFGFSGNLNLFGMALSSIIFGFMYEIDPHLPFYILIYTYIVLSILTLLVSRK